MSEDLDGMAIGDIRRELARLVAMADTGKRPKPTSIIKEGDWAGHEWRIEQQTVRTMHKTPTWVVRTVDDMESTDAVFVCDPDSYPEDNFVSMFPVDARRLGMALLAAADRADHLSAGVPRLEDRRQGRT